MKKILLMLSIGFVFLFTACGETTIDGSTEKSYRESMIEINDNLPRKKAAEFKDALAIITLDEAMKKNSVSEVGVSRLMLLHSQNEMIDIVDGKNADEVIEIGKLSQQNIDCSIMKSSIAITEKHISEMESSILKMEGFVVKFTKRNMMQNVKETEDRIEKTKTRIKEMQKRMNEVEHNISNNCY